MKHLKTLPLLATLPLLFAMEPTATKIAFGPESGTSLTKTFTHGMSLSLDSMSVLVNGEEPPGMPELDMTMDHSQTITVTDKYVNVKGGKAAKLARTFDELSMEIEVDMMMTIMGQDNEQSQSLGGGSELEGKTVLFTWDEDEEEHAIAFEEEGGDEELLTGLTEDMDLRGLLPAGEVSEGDTWAIEPRALVDVIAPGGNLQILPEDSEDGMNMMGMPTGGGMSPSFHELFGDVLEGEANGKFEGIREVDGARCAAIQITIDLDSSNDLTDMVKEAMEDMELPIEAEFEIGHMELEFAVEAEGLLLWDLARGVFKSFEISGDIRILVDQGFDMDMQGQLMSMEQTIELSGTMNLEAKTGK